MTQRQMFGEWLRSFLFKPEAQEYRDARYVRRDENQRPAVEQHLTQAEASGDVSKVLRFSKKNIALDKKEGNTLMDQAVQVRLSLTRQLKLLNYVRDAVKMDLHTDASLDEKRKNEILTQFETEFEGTRKEMEAIIQSIFQGETSFNSINVTLKNLQKLDVKSRELCYAYLMAKREARRSIRAEKGLKSKARSAKEVESPSFMKRVNAFREHQKQEMEFLKKATAYTLNMLQSDRDDLDKKQKHIKDLMEHQGFPKGIGEEIVKDYDTALLDLQKVIHDDISKERIAESQFEHQKAA